MAPAAAAGPVSCTAGRIPDIMTDARSSVAQWQSARLLTGGLQVRILPEEPSSCHPALVGPLKGAPGRAPFSVAAEPPPPIDEKGEATVPSDLTWQEWKRWLSRAVEAAQAAGAGPGELVSSAERLGDFLARHVDPANPQQRALQELWSVADQQEQRAIASALVKLVAQDRYRERGGQETAGSPFTLR